MGPFQRFHNKYPFRRQLFHSLLFSSSILHISWHKCVSRACHFQDPTNQAPQRQWSQLQPSHVPWIILRLAPCTSPLSHVLIRMLPDIFEWDGDVKYDYIISLTDDKAWTKILSTNNLLRSHDGPSICSSFLHCDNDCIVPFLYNVLWIIQWSRTCGNVSS